MSVVEIEYITKDGEYTVEREYVDGDDESLDRVLADYEASGLRVLHYRWWQ